jgi:hypothetical protein
VEIKQLMEAPSQRKEKAGRDKLVSLDNPQMAKEMVGEVPGLLVVPILEPVELEHRALS